MCRLREHGLGISIDGTWLDALMHMLCGSEEEASAAFAVVLQWCLKQRLRFSMDKTHVVVTLSNDETQP
jgi:hypothetical protein